MSIDMARLGRPVASVLWIGVLLVLGRIVSGGAITVESARYAIATLPLPVAAWVLATGAASLAAVFAIAGDRSWARTSLAFAVPTIPLGLVLAALGHDSAIAASVFAALIGVASSFHANRQRASRGASADL